MLVKSTPLVDWTIFLKRFFTPLFVDIYYLSVCVRVCVRNFWQVILFQYWPLDKKNLDHIVGRFNHKDKML